MEKEQTPIKLKEKAILFSYKLEDLFLKPIDWIVENVFGDKGTIYDPASGLYGGTGLSKKDTSFNNHSDRKQ